MEMQRSAIMEKLALLEEPPCGRPSPELFPGAGRGAPHNGGCAFRGAKLALQPITDAAHLVHGPITCQGHSWESRPTCSSGPTIHRSTFITDMGEMDVIFGGADKLRRAIREIAAQCAPTAIFVYQTCLPAMIGDDISAVCKAESLRCGRPVIAVDAPGFSGDNVQGNEFAGRLLLDRVVGSREPEFTTSADVNIIGEYNVAGELNAVRALLGGIAVRVLASIPGDGRYEDIASSHRAGAAISLCSRALPGLASHMRERFGIPFIEGSFYGISNTSNTLRGIAALLAERGGPPDLPARAEALTAGEEKRTWSRLSGCRKRLEGKRALLATGGVKSWSLVSALQELGITVVGSSMHKSTAADRRKTAEAMGPSGVLCDDASARTVESLLSDRGVDVVLSGCGLQPVAAMAGVPWVEVNHHRLGALGGYEGMARLAEAIDAACANPVFEQAFAPAPWNRRSNRPPEEGGLAWGA